MPDETLTPSVPDPRFQVPGYSMGSYVHEKGSNSTEAMLEFLARKDVRIMEVKEDENDYVIDALFITFYYGDTLWTGYSLGFNHRREQTILSWDCWFGNDFGKFKTAKALPKEKTIAMIAERFEAKKGERERERGRKKSREARAYGWLADMLDADGAATELEDNPDILGLFGDGE